MKKYLFCAILLWSAFTGINARDGFAIVIDPKSYNEARQEVEAYAQCVEQLHHLKVYTVTDRWGIPDSIRATLKALHEQKKEPVVGAVFIGDIPVVMVRDGQHMTSAFKMDQRTDRRQSSIPSDRFYDDFGLKFKYLDKDSVMPYYYYSVTADSRQHLEPAIYSGRIHPTDAGGTSRYDKLRKYLKKLVAEKQKEQHLQKMFYFSGHGYISESKVARIDEKAAWFEHYPWLKNRFDNIGYMDHTDHNPVKRHLMNELMRTDLDLAVLHHHGYWDTQYLNGMKQILTVRQAKEFIMQASREHIYGAKQKGRDYEKMQKDIKEKFDLPDSWFKDALSDSLARLDSLEGAMEDLHLEDFAEYNYHPNTPVVIIDACFCGSFHKEDCIANEYIFQPGHTVAVIANTVNVLQDKWSDRLAGLIAEGGCVGDIVRYATYLESHVIGDPTFRFTPQSESVDIDHIILTDKTSDWKKLLKSDIPDYQALAIEHLVRKGVLTSADLKDIYENSPVGIVRLMALMKIADMRDDNAINVIGSATQDGYEMVQRQAIRCIASSGDERLIPSLIKLCISNNTSDRVNFDAMQALSVLPKEKLMAEFEKQFDNPAIQYIDKDSVRNIIGKSIKNRATYYTEELMSLDTISSAKTVRFALRGLRNNLVHHMVPQVIRYAETTTDPELQVVAIEALGWHPASYMVPQISEACLRISKNNSFTPEVRNEALKTYNRIHGK